jgi:hypothetical protein
MNTPKIKTKKLGATWHLTEVCFDTPGLTADSPARHYSSKSEGDPNPAAGSRINPHARPVLQWQLS